MSHVLIKATSVLSAIPAALRRIEKARQNAHLGAIESYKTKKVSRGLFRTEVVVVSDEEADEAYTKGDQMLADLWSGYPTPRQENDAHYDRLVHKVNVLRNLATASIAHGDGYVTMTGDDLRILPMPSNILRSEEAA